MTVIDSTLQRVQRKKEEGGGFLRNSEIQVTDCKEKSIFSDKVKWDILLFCNCYIFSNNVFS